VLEKEASNFSDAFKLQFFKTLILELQITP